MILVLVRDQKGFLLNPNGRKDVEYAQQQSILEMRLIGGDSSRRSSALSSHAAVGCHVDGDDV